MSSLSLDLGPTLDPYLNLRRPRSPNKVTVTGLQFGIWTYILGATTQLPVQCSTPKQREGIRDLGLGPLPSDVCFCKFVPNTMLTEHIQGV